MRKKTSNFVEYLWSYFCHRFSDVFATRKSIGFSQVNNFFPHEHHVSFLDDCSCKGGANIFKKNQASERTPQFIWQQQIFFKESILVMN
jgi:hypothetical protein